MFKQWDKLNKKKAEIEKEERAQHKVKTKEEAEKTFTLNIKNEDGTTKPVVVKNSMTVASFKEKIHSDHFISATKKSFKSVRLVWNGIDLTLSPRRTLKHFRMNDGDVVQLFFSGRGGGKRGRQTRDTALDIGVIISPKIEPNDIDFVKCALSLNEINITGWLDTLSVETLQKMVDVMDGQSRTGNVGFSHQPTFGAHCRVSKTGRFLV